MARKHGVVNNNVIRRRGKSHQSKKVVPVQLKSNREINHRLFGRNKNLTPEEQAELKLLKNEIKRAKRRDNIERSLESYEALNKAEDNKKEFKKSIKAKKETEQEAQGF